MFNWTRAQWQWASVFECALCLGIVRLQVKEKSENHNRIVDYNYDKEVEKTSLECKEALFECPHEADVNVTIGL